MVYFRLCTISDSAASSAKVSGTTIGEVQILFGDLLARGNESDPEISLQIQSPGQSLQQGELMLKVLRVNEKKSMAHPSKEEGISEVNSGITILATWLIRSSDKSLSRVTLAEDSWTRFEKTNGLEDLDKSINYGRQALDSCPRHHHYDRVLGNLAIALHHRFTRQIDIKDLNEAIVHYKLFLEKNSPEHCRYSLVLVNLAIALQTRFDVRGSLPDLNLAIEYYEGVLKIRPLGHRGHVDSLLDLATALSTRFKRSSNKSDLDQAIEHYDNALKLCVPGHNRHPAALMAFSNSLLSRFEVAGDMRDVDFAILHLNSILDLLPSEHPNLPSALLNVSGALVARYKKRGGIQDVDQAIDHLKRAALLYPPGHHSLSNVLMSTGNALLIRSGKQGDQQIVNQAIEYYSTAVKLRPRGHPNRCNALSGLATAFQSRFELLGNFQDLDLAIEHHENSVELYPPGHINHPRALMNLANALQSRFEHLRSVHDLDQAIVYHSNALELRPLGHPSRFKALMNFATALESRFDLRGDIRDLDRAIEYYEYVVESYFAENPNRPKALLNLGSARVTRFKKLRDEGDLTRAIKDGEDALRHPSLSLPLRASFLLQLVDALLARFELHQNAIDLHNVFSHLHSAFKCLPTGHPRLYLVYRLFSAAYFVRYTVTHDLADQQRAFDYIKSASTHPSAGSHKQLTSCMRWISKAESLGHPSALEAHSTSLNILDRHVIATSTITSRYQTLKSLRRSFAADSASCAIRANEIELAVVLLEQGRALLWTQLSRFRTSLDDLQCTGGREAQLAVTLQQLGRELERGGSSLGPHGALVESCSSLEAGARRYRKLSAQWENTVQEIRQLEGYVHFLMPTPFDELKKAADKGPIIIVNISRYRCDAIVVLGSGKPHVVPLVQITLEDVSQLSQEFGAALKMSTAAGEEKIRENQIIRVLRQLWDLIVYPIVNKLKALEADVPLGSRIWWCPTSKLASLPLHAAGPYRMGEQNLPHLFVSSYTPTLSALIRSKKDKSTVSESKRAFLAVGQSNPYGTSCESDLQSVSVELEAVRRKVVSSPMQARYSQLIGDEATAGAVMNAFRKHGWIHLASHGKQDMLQPFESNFALRDKPLRLLDIIHAELEHPEFAFLSACHTAVGDKDTPDEVIHLAAGVQFSGFRSVIGTMWAVDDKTVPHVVSEFYNHLIGSNVDCTNAALALHKAAKTVRKFQVPLDQRIVFIHIGA
ncbi:hypothetical protein SERLADRAFT_414544 [Serpula lacrymans var. lacrymans S7.9]|uniref:CHAT domain-containing protein n=1 Tax=Serpula lacrymans var. lacrymans (strain S7.9) TaxID=578457 RepID=F8NQ92_SERL9|nr:uncharacterized protein SERLADRAFT_414544 [Serpula lacrymans var. lacrymans S7.9]EGO26552.1 hypothetical protein SERLADRAFT_414544 [Serpula lacrymans var. lacrymans S7.9]